MNERVTDGAESHAVVEFVRSAESASPNVMGVQTVAAPHVASLAPAVAFPKYVESEATPRFRAAPPRPSDSFQGH